MDGTEAGDGGVSIGEGNQLRDREMLQEKQRRDAIEGGYGAEPSQTAEEQRRDQESPKPAA